jgi:4-hydroxy-2-oxoheptanedioate aldolase
MSAWSDDWTTDQARTHADAIAAVLAACRRHGVAPGIHTGDGGTARRYIDQGFLMVTVANELGLISNGGRAELARARGSVT